MNETKSSNFVNAIDTKYLMRAMLICFIAVCVSRSTTTTHLDAQGECVAVAVTISVVSNQIDC